tara:strand:- start:36 stop:173 length:138 start_codon:yes stop_codon:yes gene_type:complete
MYCGTHDGDQHTEIFDLGQAIKVIFLKKVFLKKVIFLVDNAQRVV